MSALLERIAVQTRADVEARRDLHLPDRTTRSPKGQFRQAIELDGDALGLIAEVKPRSPSHGPLPRAADLEEVFTAYEHRAHAVSVLVDERFFGGGLELLARARQRLPLPILAKGFFLETRQIDEAYAYGADAILLIVRLLDPAQLRRLQSYARKLGLAALVEVHTDAELDEAIAAEAEIIGVNARDLDTLRIDLDAMGERLERIPQGILRVAESGLHQREDVERMRGRADACLVGAAFMKADNVAGAIEGLGW